MWCGPWSGLEEAVQGVGVQVCSEPAAGELQMEVEVSCHGGGELNGARSLDGGDMDLVESEDITAENASEEKLWIQETSGSEENVSGIKKMIMRQHTKGVNGSKHPLQGAPRINILRCSIDSDDISSNCSTPGSGMHRADQLSPVSQTPGGPNAG